MSKRLAFNRLKRKIIRRLLLFAEGPLLKDAYTDPDYAAWFERHRTNENELKLQRSFNFQTKPLFSIIVPLFKTPIAYLEDMASSVLGQSYNHFELILVNASPEISGLCNKLDSFSAKDPRVRVVTLDGNAGIAENTSVGLDHAKGDFVSFLDHDDFIAPDALFRFAQALEEDPTIDLFYCDEDLVDESGTTHLHPLFKPSYSPDLLLSKNYLVHFLTIRRSLLGSMERQKAELDGAQDYNMTFFATERARTVCHIPKVLYHWRMSTNSTLVSPMTKPYSEEAGRQAILKHLQRTNQAGSVLVSDIQYIYKTDLAIIGNPLVTIVLDMGSGKNSIKRTIASLVKKAGYPNLELIIVTENNLPNVQKIALPVNQVRVDPAASQAARLNLAAKSAKGSYILFLESPMRLQKKGAIRELLMTCQRERVGAVAAKTLFTDNRVKYCGFALPPNSILPLYRGVPKSHPGYFYLLRCKQDISAIPMFGTMVKKSTFDQVGGLNEKYLSMAMDIEFCMRLTDKGFFLVQMPDVEVKVAERSPKPCYSSALDPTDFDKAEIDTLRRSHPEQWVKPDPYFNINLDQESGYYQIKHA